MAGFKTFVAGEILTAADVNSFLMGQAISVFADATARNAAITSPVEGQFAFRKDDDVLEYWDGSAWEEYSTGFAKISDTPTGTYTDGGIDYAYWTFNSNGSLTVTKAGFLDIMVIGGGGGGARNEIRRSGGGAGCVRYGIFEVSATTHSITVGAGGAGAHSGSSGSLQQGGNGSPSTFGSVLRSGGGGGGRALSTSGGFALSAVGDGGSGGGANTSSDANGGGAGPSGGIAGIDLNYSGSSVTYGLGGASSVATAAASDLGNGGNCSTNATTNNGGSGIVIARVRV
jgi:hypothetical protein